MQISLTHIPINPILQGYIEKLWVFEASGRVPNVDMKLIVPNGMVKLVIPFRNGLVGQRDSYSKLSKKDEMTIVGINDVPFVVDAEQDIPSGTIGVEFSPLGAYRFFRLKQCDLKNGIFLMDEVLNKAVREIQERIAETDNVKGKIKLLQDFLLQHFSKTSTDNIFEHCVKQIQTTNGRITMKKLEKSTGYSTRWLNMKFEERIGISPKNLCSITRFQFVYQTLVNNPNQLLHNKDYYNIYYDQSHFIKEFKRFTGMPPAKFEKQNNDFGKLFYKS